MKTSIFVTLVLLAGLSACSILNPAGPAVGSSWELTQLTHAGQVIAIDSPNPISLEVREDGEVGGHSGCNVYFGTMKFKSGGSLETDAFGGTEMACLEGMEVEGAFLSAINTVEQYVLEDARLILSTEDGLEVLVFQGVGN